MMPESARRGLRRILEYADRKDLKMVELRIVPGVHNRKTQKDEIDAILSHARKPSEILSLKCLRKSVIELYLQEVRGPMSEHKSKSDCIHTCLKLWKVKDDNYLLRFQSEDEIREKIARLEDNLEEDIQGRKDEYREECNLLKDKLKKDIVKLKKRFKENCRPLKSQLRRIESQLYPDEEPSTSFEVKRESRTGGDSDVESRTESEEESRTKSEEESRTDDSDEEPSVVHQVKREPQT